jgi:hypothetical protein
VGAGTYGATTVGTVTSATNGWYRCAVTGSTQGGVNGYSFARIGIISSSTWSNASGTGGQMAYTGTTATIYAWGAQVEQRSTSTPYTVTTASVITNYVPQLQVASTNSARLDYNPSTGESLGLLIEEQRTNLMLQSELFTSSPWAQVVGATATVTQSGWNVGFNIGQVIATTANGGIRQSVSGLTSGQVYTLSFYLQSTLTNIFLFTENGGAAYGTLCTVTINAVTGATSGLGGFTSVTSTAFGNGRIYQVVLPAAGGGLAANMEWKSGTTGVPFYLGKPQFEAASVASSYIPTTASAVTRGADNVTITGTNFSSWFDQGQGVFYVESATNTLSSNAGPNALRVHDGTNNNRIQLGRTNVTSLALRVYATNNGADYLSAFGNGTTTQGQFAKTIFSYANNNFIGVVNSTVTNSASVGIVPVLNKMDIGYDSIVQGNYLNGWIKKIAYYSQALPLSQLQTLTG